MTPAAEAALLPDLRRDEQMAALERDRQALDAMLAGRAPGTASPTAPAAPAASPAARAGAGATATLEQLQADGALLDSLLESQDRPPAFMQDAGGQPLTRDAARIQQEYETLARRLAAVPPPEASRPEKTATSLAAGIVLPAAGVLKIGTTLYRARIEQMLAPLRTALELAGRKKAAQLVSYENLMGWSPAAWSERKARAWADAMLDQVDTRLRDTVGRLDVTGALAKGDYARAGESLLYATLLNVPQYGVAMLATAWGVPHLGYAILGAAAGGQKDRQLEQANPEMAADMRRFNALATGAAEGVFERIGTGWIVGKIMEPAARAGLQDGIARGVRRVLAGAAVEAAEEIDTQVAQNLIDIVTDTRGPDGKLPTLFAGALEAGVQALPLGALGGAAAHASARRYAPAPARALASTPSYVPSMPMGAETRARLESAAGGPFSARVDIPGGGTAARLGDTWVIAMPGAAPKEVGRGRSAAGDKLYDALEDLAARAPEPGAAAPAPDRPAPTAPAAGTGQDVPPVLGQGTAPASPPAAKPADSAGAAAPALTLATLPPAAKALAERALAQKTIQAGGQTVAVTGTAPEGLEIRLPDGRLGVLAWRQIAEFAAGGGTAAAAPAAGKPAEPLTGEAAANVVAQLPEAQRAPVAALLEPQAKPLAVEGRSFRATGVTREGVRFQEYDAEGTPTGRPVTLTFAESATDPAAALATPELALEEKAAPWTAKSPQPGHRHKRASGRWAVVELASLGRGAGLQDRDRSRQASAEQIETHYREFDADELADSVTSDRGAIIADRRGRILAGYGRRQLLEKVYGHGGEKAAAYRAMVTGQAARLGVAAQVEGKKQPVLVRVAESFANTDAPEFAAESNARVTLGYSAAEQMLRDARTIEANNLLPLLDVPESGDLGAASNAEFANAFMRAANIGAEFRTADGRPLPDLVARMERAALGALVGDSPRAMDVARHLAEHQQEPAARRILGGLVRAAPHLLKLRSTHARFDLIPALGRAIPEAIAAVEQTSGENAPFKSLAAYFAQPSLFAGAPEGTRELAALLLESSGAPEVAAVLQTYIQAVRAIDERSPSLFAQTEIPEETLIDILKRSMAHVRTQAGKRGGAAAAGDAVAAELAARDRAAEPGGAAAVRAAPDEPGAGGARGKAAGGAAGDGAAPPARPLSREEFTERFGRMVERAAAGQDVTEVLWYRPVSEREAAAVRAQNGPEIGGLWHEFEGRRVRHALKEHADAATEAAHRPPQRPLTVEDARRLPEVIDEYDTLTVQRRADGTTSILYAKQMPDGTLVVAERAIETSRKGEPRLSLRTAWAVASAGVESGTAQVYTPGRTDENTALPAKVKPAETRGAASAYLNEQIEFGGELRSRGSVIAELQRAGTPQKGIDAYMMGAATVGPGALAAGTAAGDAAAGQTLLPALRALLSPTETAAVAHGQVQIVNTLDDLPPETRAAVARAEARQQAGGADWTAPAGFFHEGRGWVVLAHCATPAEAHAVLRHELTHAALARFPKLRRMVLQALARSRLSPELTALVQRIRGLGYPETLVAEEVIAYAGGDRAGRDPGLWATVRAGLKLALARLGIPAGRITEADLRALAAAARRADSAPRTPQVPAGQEIERPGTAPHPVTNRGVDYLAANRLYRWWHNVKPEGEKEGDIRFAAAGQGAQAAAARPLAPNGQPSRLTPRQYRQVRTPQFKAWFGDWEAAGNRAFLLGEPVAAMAEDTVPRFPKIKQLARWVATHWQEANGGQAVHPELGRVALDYRAASSSIGHGMNATKAQAFYLVPAVVRTGRLLGQLGKSRPSQPDAFLIGAPVMIGTRSYIALVEVRRDTNIQRMYVHEVVLREKENQPGFYSAASGMAAGTPHGPKAGHIRNLLAAVLAVNPADVSQAVDANGEPLVLYHGSSQPRLERFAPEAVGDNFGQDRRGFFFSDRRETAEIYARNDAQGMPRETPGAVVPAFVVLRNPLVHEIDYDPIAEWDAKHEQLQAAADALKADGIVVRAASGPSLYVAFRPEQIKSATENSGAFAPANPDIRFAAAGQGATAAPPVPSPAEEAAQSLARRQGVSVLERMFPSLIEVRNELLNGDTWRWGEGVGGRRPELNRADQRRQGAMQAAERRTLRVMRRLNRALKPLTPEQRAALNNLLHGETDATAVPGHGTAPVRAALAAVADARAHLDALSTRLADSGIVPETLGLTIRENLGHYVVRAYRKYADPAWRPSLEQTLAAASQVDGQFQEWLERAAAGMNRAVARYATPERRRKLMEYARTLDPQLLYAETDAFKHLARRLAAIRAGVLRTFGDRVTFSTETRDFTPEIGALDGEIMALRQQYGQVMTDQTQAAAVRRRLRRLQRRRDDLALLREDSALRIRLEPAGARELIEGTLKEILDRGTPRDPDFGRDRAPGSPQWRLIEHSWKRRRDIPESIREYMGEIHDAGALFQMAAMRLEQNLVTHRFQSELLAAQPQDPHDPACLFVAQKQSVAGAGGQVRDFIHQVPDTAAYGPLRNLWCDGPTYALITQAEGQARSPLERRYMKLISTLRFLKTVPNPATHLRNFLGNYLFALADGEMLHAPAYAHGWKETMRLLAALATGDEAAERTWQAHLESGLISSNGKASELRDSVRRAFGDPSMLSPETWVEGITAALRTARETAVNLYALEDSVHKLAAYYSKVHRGLSPEAARQRVRDSFPYYDMAPRLVTTLARYSPFLSDFLTFKAETYRITLNNWRHAWADAQKGDLAAFLGTVAAQGAGTALLAGKWGGALLIAQAIAAALRAATGEDWEAVEDDEERATRALLPAWQRFNSLILLRGPDGQTRLIDFGYLSPYDTVAKASLLAGAGIPGSGRLDVATDMLADVAGAPLGVRAFAEFVTNKSSDSGREVRTDAGWYLNRLLPTPAPAAYRIGQILTADQPLAGPGGELDTVASQAARFLAPLRIRDLNPQLLFEARAAELGADLRDIKAAAGRARLAATPAADTGLARQPAASGEKAVAEARTAVEEEIAPAAAALVASGQRLGLDTGTLDALLKQAGWAAADREAVLYYGDLTYREPEEQGPE